MKRTIETKFWNIMQNNSGGYFVEDEENGVCEEIIIEAQNADEARTILRKIGDKVDGFWSYCGCCGERWYDYLEESDGKETPSHYDTPLEHVTREIFRTRCFVHYYDGTIKEFKFKQPNNN